MKPVGEFDGDNRQCHQCGLLPAEVETEDDRQLLERWRRRHEAVERRAARIRQGGGNKGERYEGDLEIYMPATAGGEGTP
jgi:hypothetical protein